MTAKVSENLFQASWPKSPQPSIVTHISSSIFGYLASFVFSRIIPGNSYSNGKMVRAMGDQIKMQSPDGAVLDGALIKGNRNPEKVILFGGGNAMRWEDSVDTILDLLESGASVLFLNPRGVGESKGRLYSKGYALDFYTAYEYLIQKGFEVENVLPVGFSIGGANTVRGAALIQEKYPGKKISAINICSFSSLSSEIKELLGGGVIGTVVSLAARLIGVEMTVTEDWNKLKGKKCIFVNPKDKMIPQKASLYHAVNRQLGQLMDPEEKGMNHFIPDNKQLLPKIQELL